MATSLGKIIVEFVGDTKGLDRSTKRVGKSIDNVGKKSATASTKTKGLTSSFGALKASTLAYVAAATAVVAVIAKSLGAWDQQQQAIIALNNALANQGAFSAQASADLQRYASSLQAVTTFGDETVLKGMALASTFGLQGDKLKQTTKLALDFATATRRDLTMAMNLLGKASVGETAELKRYGIIIDQNLPKNQKFAAVLEQLEQRFGGAAKAAANTFGGALKQAGNLIGDMFEGIGKTISVILGFGNAGYNAMSPMLFSLTNMSEFFNTILPTAIAYTKSYLSGWVAAALDGFIQILNGVALLPDWLGGGVVTDVAAKLTTMSESLKTNAAAALKADLTYISLGQTQNQVNASLEQNANALTNQANQVTTLNIPSLDMYRQKTEENILTLEKMTEGIEFTTQKFQWQEAQVGGISSAIAASFERMGQRTRTDMKASVDQMKSDYDIMQASGEATAQALQAAWEKYIAAKNELEEKSNKMSIEGHLQVVDSALGGFAQLGGKFKVFAIAQAIISTYLAIAKSLASLPWPMNLVAAAGAAAAGFANVAKIKSSKAYRTGTPNLDYAAFGRETPAMLHGSEAVIPRGGGHALAGEIAASLPGAAMDLSSMTAGMGSISASGGAKSPTMVHTTLVINGRELVKAITPAYEKASKTGSLRTYPSSVRAY